VSRDNYVKYLEEYVNKYNIPIEFGTRVAKVIKLENGWQIETSKETILTKHAILSCGANRIPKMPDISGLDVFNGVVRHASAFGEVNYYDDKKVLVIGGGNSAFDIGNHLIKRPLKELIFSIRTAPGITAKEVFGFPMHILAALLRDLPLRIQDALFYSTQNNVFGDLKLLNIGETPKDVFTKHARDGITVSVDEGLIKAIRQKKARVVKEVKEIKDNTVFIKDGEQFTPDIILCATGYHSGLEPLIGHLGVLDSYGLPTTTGPQKNILNPGLWFIGLRGYIWGNMLEQLRQSKKLAKVVFLELGKTN
jgi:cation diffusion facilitator CzcD-associated flavoprotein CzcO